MTVCLAVLGKYVPGLRFFATFLGEESPLKPDVRFYQRLLARDHDGAAALADEVLKDRPRVEFFDEIAIPTLSMLERDSVHEDVDEGQRDFAWWAIEEIVQDLESTRPRDIDRAPSPAESDAAALPGQDVHECGKVVGVPANDRGDFLALRMLQVVVEAEGCKIALLEPGLTPLQQAEKLSADLPDLIVISHVPPAGLTTTRYLVRRLHARLPEVAIIVGRWSEKDDNDSAERLIQAGATQVVSSLAEAREAILQAPVTWCRTSYTRPRGPCRTNVVSHEYEKRKA